MYERYDLASSDRSQLSKAHICVVDSVLSSSAQHEAIITEIYSTRFILLAVIIIDTRPLFTTMATRYTRIQENQVDPEVGPTMPPKTDAAIDPAIDNEQTPSTSTFSTCKEATTPQQSRRWKFKPFSSLSGILFGIIYAIINLCFEIFEQYALSPP